MTTEWSGVVKLQKRPSILYVAYHSKGNEMLVTNNILKITKIYYLTNSVRPLMTTEWSGVVKSQKRPIILYVAYHSNGNEMLVTSNILKNHQYSLFNQFGSTIDDH